MDPAPVCARAHGAATVSRAASAWQRAGTSRWRTGRHGVAVGEDVVVDGDPVVGRHGRVQAQHLVDDLLHVAEVLDVLRGGVAVAADHLINLLEQLGLDLGVVSDHEAAGGRARRREDTAEGD